MENNIVVYGIYQTRSAVEQSVTQLRSEDFTSKDISVLFASSSSSREFAHENSTKAPEGAATGAISGATVGGVFGWLAGIGSLTLPGIGPFVAAGPIMAALAGASLGGTVGGIAGALIGLGIPEYEAKRYEGKVKDGGILISINADNSDRAEKARLILEVTGAQDICKKSEAASDNPPTGEMFRTLAL